MPPGETRVFRSIQRRQGLIEPYKKTPIFDQRSRLRNNFIDKASRSFISLASAADTDNELTYEFILELFNEEGFGFGFDFEHVFVADCTRRYEGDVDKKREAISSNFARLAWICGPYEVYHCECCGPDCDSFIQGYDRAKTFFNSLMQKLKQYTRIDEWGNEFDIRRFKKFKRRYGPTYLTDSGNWAAKLVKEMHSSMFLGWDARRTFVTATSPVTMPTPPYQYLINEDYHSLFEWECNKIVEEDTRVPSAPI